MQNKLKIVWMCESAGSMEMLPRLKKLRRKRQMQIIRNRYINDGQFWGSSLLALSVSNGTSHQFVYARLHTTLLHLPMRGHEKIWHNIHIKIQICIKVHICIKIYMKNIIYVSKFIRKRLWKLRDCWLTYSIPQSWIGVTWNKELLKKTMHILLRYL